MTDSKQQSRDHDAEVVRSGEKTWLEVSRDNALATSVIHLYTPSQRIGFPVKKHKQCPQCGQEAVRDEKHDAYACKHCDVWLEDQCEATDCEFCPARPEKPSQVAVQSQQ